MIHARESARELIEVGQALNDPRSTGQGLNLLTWIALVSDSYAEALEYSEQSLTVAIAPLDKIGATGGKGCAIEAASNTTDVYIQNWIRWAVGWEEFHRSRSGAA
jgi:hypothetical protein